MVHSVELSSDAYLMCLTHALSTEREEVMGLLLGEVSLISPWLMAPMGECHFIFGE